MYFLTETVYTGLNELKFILFEFLSLKVNVIKTKLWLFLYLYPI